MVDSSNDDRLFLQVQILGLQVISLLDCGASISILGAQGQELVQKLELPIEKCEVKNVELADKTHNKVLGKVELPITLNEKTFLVTALLVPAVEQKLILGLNFWHQTGFVPNVQNGTYSLAQNTDHEKCAKLSSVSADGDKLTDEQSKELNDLITETKKMFPHKLGRTSIYEHVIDTARATPVKCKQIYVPPPQLEHLHNWVDEMSELGVIEKANSPWSSPIFPVKRDDPTKSPRWVLDMRRVNDVTVPDAYGIPIMTSVLDNVGESKFISSIDFTKSYYQVPLQVESRPKTAFFVPDRGQYQFTVVPFGAINSGPGFMRCSDKLLEKSWIKKYIIRYVDDFFVRTPTFELHCKVLRELFRLLFEANLVPNWDKCSFLRKSVKILGYILDESGLHPDPQKVAPILQLAQPKNVTEIKSFLGVCSYYRRMIPNFSTVAEPLTRLTRKEVHFTWESEQTMAFKAIKEALISEPVVRLPDFSRDFILATDASEVGISGVLSQKFDDGEFPVHFVSRTLTQTETRYPTIHKEALAIIWAIERLEGYLAYKPFLLLSDSKPLKYIRDMKNPKGQSANWNWKLQKYAFTAMHIPGKHNLLPDLTSRSFSAAVKISPIALKTPVRDTWYINLIDKVTQEPQKYPLFKVLNRKLFKLVKSWNKWEDSEYKEVVPKGSRQKVMEQNHNVPEAGHFGFFKTYNKIAEHHYWPKMRSDISKFVANCHECHKQKPSQAAPAGYMSSHPVDRPWQVVCSDIVGEFPRSKLGNKYLLTVVDFFSKFVILTPLRDATAKSVCNAIEKSIMQFGAPELLIQDNAKIYQSGEFKNMAKRYNSRLQYTPRYHPQANPSERVNRVVETVIRSCIADDQRNWDQNIQQIAFAINSSVHETTKLSPHLIFFSRQPSLFVHDKPSNDSEQPLDPVSAYTSRFPKIRKIHELVKANIAESNKRNAQHYNMRRRPSDFAVGDKVMKRNFVLSKKGAGFSAKLAPTFVGPFVLKAQVAPHMFTLADYTDQDKEFGDFDTKDLKKLQKQ